MPKHHSQDLAAPLDDGVILKIRRGLGEDGKEAADNERRGSEGLFLSEGSEGERTRTPKRGERRVLAAFSGAPRRAATRREPRSGGEDSDRQTSENVCGVEEEAASGTE